MNKDRLEVFSDGVFSIIILVLIFEFRLPESNTDATLLEGLRLLIPIFLAYIVSFIVLDMFWVSHNMLFHIFVKNVNRVLIQLNMLYLAFLSFVPFLAHILGRYPGNSFAVILYGLDILCLGMVNYAMLRYALASDEIDTSHNSPRTIKKSIIRLSMTPIMTAIGMVMTVIYIPAAFFFYAFPIRFNIIPGSGALDWIEKRFGLDFGDK